jgi:hypothetical protein
MKKKESKPKTVEEFKTATIATVRALSRDSNTVVSFTSKKK